MNRKIFAAILLGALSVETVSASPFTQINKWGDMFMVMPTVYALGMSVVYQDYTGMAELGASVVSAQLATEGLKKIVKEKRPNGKDRMSFPSGHAAGAFSGAMFVHRRYGWKPALVPYAFSVITGYSRVHARAHYWHDVLGGAAVSALFTYALVDKYDKNISISATPDGASVAFKTTF